MKQNNKPKPCPFCGAPAFVHELEPHEHSTFLKALIPGMPDHSGSYVIEGSCECGSGLMADTREQVVAMWNRRAPDARDARIAELEAELAAEPRATDAPTAVAAADPQLLKFYGAASDAELIAAQAAHIKRLQAKLPPAPSFAPQRVREG